MPFVSVRAVINTPEWQTKKRWILCESACPQLQRFSPSRRGLCFTVSVGDVIRKSAAGAQKAHHRWSICHRLQQWHHTAPHYCWTESLLKSVSPRAQFKNITLHFKLCLLKWNFKWFHGNCAFSTNHTADVWGTFQLISDKVCCCIWPKVARTCSAITSSSVSQRITLILDESAPHVHMQEAVWFSHRSVVYGCIVCFYLFINAAGLSLCPIIDFSLK